MVDSADSQATPIVISGDLFNGSGHPQDREVGDLLSLNVARKQASGFRTISEAWSEVSLVVSGGYSAMINP
jgi:hypothetical protein